MLQWVADDINMQINKIKLNFICKIIINYTCLCNI